MADKQEEKVKELLDEMAEEHEVVKQWSCVSIPASDNDVDQDVWKHSESGSSTSESFGKSTGGVPHGDLLVKE